MDSGEGIFILPVGEVEITLINEVRNYLNENFNARVFILERVERPEYSYDPLRKQYNSTKILKEILIRHRQIEGKIVGIADLDLFVPILTFVFGEAQLGGKAAVVSCARLKQEFYGLPPNFPLLQERLIKEVMHELGHTFGLVHCDKSTCVMSFSTNIRGVDLKPPFFCEACAEFLKRATKILKRNVGIK